MEDNKKAFPVVDQKRSSYDGSLEGVECTDDGMDLRDYFAKGAMQSLVKVRNGLRSDIAKEAYEMADAMMEARKKCSEK
jgi:hypothetical protein